VLARAERERPPDIVFFITDDQSQRDASPFGAEDIPTPNMQRLADAGLMFTQAYAASPSCAPSRAALLTGLMPARNGAEANHSRPRSDVKKWPAYFQELGYEVVSFGKVAHSQHAPDYGFDYFAEDRFHSAEAIPAAVEFLRERDRDATRPLCFLVGTRWPHAPWPANTEGIDPDCLVLPTGSIDTTATRTWRARYVAAVMKADHDLGLIYDAARTALPESTIFLFSSDHGSKWPFAKWTCYEAGIRVPLVVVWPGVVKPRTHTDAIVSWVDLLPTLLEAVGGDPPADIDGKSFLPLLRGSTETHRDRVFASHTGDGNWNVYPIRSYRSGEWKYILNLHPEFAFTTHIDLGADSPWATWHAAAETSPAAAAIIERYHKRPREELYDLSRDPQEQRDLARDPAHTERLVQMRTELEQWMQEQQDKGRVSGKPRLLSEPGSYGPGAPKGN
jgi:N-sulfoglucosamine sulfohydrolase